MQPSREDILGTQNPERRLKVILEHVKKPDGLAFVDLLHELELTSSDRSGIKRNHLEPLVKSGILEECYMVSEYSKREKKRPVDGHRVSGDLPTLWKVLVAAGRDRRARRTVQNSPYLHNWYPKLAAAFLWDPRIIELWEELYYMYIKVPLKKRTKPIKQAVSRVGSLVMKESLIPPPTYEKAGNLLDRIDHLEGNPLLLGNGFFDLDMNEYIGRLTGRLILIDGTEIDGTEYDTGYDTEAIRLNYFSELFIDDPSLLKKHIPKITDDTVDILKEANVVKNDLEAELGRDREEAIDAFDRGFYSNWLFLKFVVYFVTADDNEKTSLYNKLFGSIKYSRAAQFHDGYFKGLSDAHVNISDPDGVYAKRVEKGSPDTPLDYLIGLFEDMSRSFDALSSVFD